MFKRPITFQTVDGETITRDFYFNISKSELTEKNLEQAHVDGFDIQNMPKAEDLKITNTYVDRLNAIGKNGSGAEIMAAFKDIILESYGVRSEDGISFIKNEENRMRFYQSDAYSVLFEELCTDSDKAAEFIRKVFPSQESIAKGNASDQPTTRPTPPVIEKAVAGEGSGSSASAGDGMTPEQVAAFKEWQAKQNG